MTAENWRIILRERLHRFDWPRVAEDVRPLLEASTDPELLTLNNIERALTHAS
jgi:hypothetical protein